MDGRKWAEKDQVNAVPKGVGYEKLMRLARFPILFMSTEADPVAPLSSAIKMSKGFGHESAVLLVQKGYVRLLVPRKSSSLTLRGGPGHPT